MILLMFIILCVVVFGIFGIIAALMAGFTAIILQFFLWLFPIILLVGALITGIPALIIICIIMLIL